MHGLKKVMLLAGSLAFAGAAGFSTLVQGQTASPSATLAGEIAHAQKMGKLFPAPGHIRRNSVLATPPVIPQFERDADSSGAVASYRPDGRVVTKNVPFFQTLGTNGRTCFACHRPAQGWGISVQGVDARFAASADQDPLFRPIDGATCPDDDISTPAARQQAYSLLLKKGLIRIGLPIPANPEFQIIAVNDPYGCNTNPVTGLTSETSGTVSVYRRPLPTTNLGFESAFMWDGREPSLANQAHDAVLIHFQASQPPTPDQLQQIVAFESGQFTAQLFDKGARKLTADGARGGPKALAAALAGFYPGSNDPFGGNPTGALFNPDVFMLYDNWSGRPGAGATNAARQAILRGEQVFNRTPIVITGVRGLNDVLDQPQIVGTCSTCHDTPNAGNHSLQNSDFIDIGVADAGTNSPPGLDISGLPVFTVSCVSGPLAGQVFEVTDLGHAMITGKCADIGTVKTPILRGLAARPPYFHNGAAATLMDVVNFYDQRFDIGLTAQQKSDLVAFMNAL